MLRTRDPCQDKRPTQTESEGLETNFPSKRTGGKKARVGILISDKIEFERRAIKRDPEGHFIILKGRIQQEDINIVNIYAPNIRAPKYIKKILEDFKKDIDSNIIIVGDFSTPLSKVDRSSKQNIKKDFVSLNNTLEEMDLTDIYKAFHPKEAKDIFFSFLFLLYLFIYLFILLFKYSCSILPPPLSLAPSIPTSHPRSYLYIF